MPAETLPIFTPPSNILIIGSVVFLIKHLLADFILQNRWMAYGKAQRRGWSLPMMAHISVHGMMTALILLPITPDLVWLAGIDMLAHFLIDKSKAMLSQFLKVDPDSTEFWWLMGLDQTLHHATHLTLVAAMANHLSG
jgi:Protein of unknown function (DUF3307)